MNETQQNSGSINLIRNKPGSYGGKRDFLMVNTWLFKIQQYLYVSVLSNYAVSISDSDKIMFATFCISVNTAPRWYTVGKSGQLPATLENFRNFVMIKFIPRDHERCTRDKVHKPRQGTSVLIYLLGFWSCVLTVNDMTNGEKYDRFAQGLKIEVYLEVMKSQCSPFEEVTQIELHVNSALW